MANWFITGVSGGLGKALAEAALARGDKVAGTVRKQPDLDAFTATSPAARGFLLDVSDETALRSAIDAAEAEFGGLDVLVNNAGYGLIGAVEEASLSEIRAQFEVNVFAPIAAIQAVLPYFRKRRAGHVINITSVSGITAWAGTGIYTGSKFALEGVTQTLAQEVADFGIKVTNIEPGGMRTDYAGRSLTTTQASVDAYDGGPGHAAKTILAGHAGHEAGDPAKCAQAVLRIVGEANPPLQLLLGADALFYATQHLARYQAEIGKWAPVTLSTSYGEPEVHP